MHLQFQIHRRPQALKNRLCTKGFHDAKRIGKAKPARARELGGFGGAQQEIGISPRGILAADNYIQTQIQGLRHAVADGIQCLFAGPAQLVPKLLIGQGH